MRVWSRQKIDPWTGFVPIGREDYSVIVVDRWPRGRLRQTARMAYDELVRTGDIIPEGVTQESSGVVVVRYRAPLPEAWMHDMLAQVERMIIGE